MVLSSLVIYEKLIKGLFKVNGKIKERSIVKIVTKDIKLV